MTIADQIRQIRRVARVADRAAVKPIPIVTGTYTPTYFGSVTAGVTTYTTQAGFYVRIAELIFFQVRITWTAATGTGNAQVSLPFTAQNTTNMEYVVGVWSNGLTFANGNVVGRILENQNFFTFQSLLTNAVGTATAVEAAGDVIASGYFRV